MMEILTDEQIKTETDYQKLADEYNAAALRLYRLSRRLHELENEDYARTQDEQPIICG